MSTGEKRLPQQRGPSTHGHRHSPSGLGIHDPSAVPEPGEASCLVGRREGEDEPGEGEGASVLVAVQMVLMVSPPLFVLLVVDHVIVVVVSFCKVGRDVSHISF